MENFTDDEVMMMAIAFEDEEEDEDQTPPAKKKKSCRRWNFPNCLGTLDGKHIFIKKPPNSGTEFYNNKVDVGAKGRDSDGGIFANSNLGHAVENNNRSVPSDSILPGTDIGAPYVIVGDEAFPLKTYVMRPYPGQDLNNQKRIFNYRLSRARRTSENAFGILTQKFRIFNRRMELDPAYADKIVLATCILHNFIRQYDGMQDVHSGEGPSHQHHLELAQLSKRGGNSSKSAFQVREIYENYFNSEARAVPWQNESINNL
ncbi:uncharacterized protein LOC131429036 [Malaya genurostris]|uniref:uncharacterized protein LOC131429036 n=1 Tax=Malaya genurostris TaxID=325434 RepID=UPI0026F4073B|nr:uncharacterized protein LOC131429036 [Malaya genurostris]